MNINRKTVTRLNLNLENVLKLVDQIPNNIIIIFLNSEPKERAEKFKELYMTRKVSKNEIIEDMDKLIKDFMLP